MVETVERIRPQEGYQMKALSSKADIVIGGAAAGVGKTFTLLLEPLKHIITTEGFGGVIFRRTTTQIKNEGGLWDTSTTLFTKIPNTRPRESSLEWMFDLPSGKSNKIKFAHLEYEKNIYDWQGSQIPFIGFDELTHFTEKMFFYLLSRNRSVCGVKPYVRATCNPDPESWVYNLISWWIDDEGDPIPERDGVVRYFIKNAESYIWGDTVEEVHEKSAWFLDKLIKESGLDKKDFIKSITFVSGSIYDNKKLLSKDPSYLGNLLAQDEQTQRQLLKGNWKFIPSDLDIYNYHSFVGMFENFINVTGKKRITADIALKGSNKFIVGVWDGFELIDLAILDTSNGKQVIDTIIAFMKKYSIPNSSVVYDNDGVGGFVDGFIVGSIPFVNNAKALNKENYDNLKTQCYYKSGDRVNNGGYRVSEKVANMMYDDKMTVRQRFIYERKAIKRAKTDFDGKLKIIGKDEMKTMLKNESPDLMDMFCFREVFELTPVVEWKMY